VNFLPHDVYDPGMAKQIARSRTTGCIDY
jgi:hypothetical protein